MEIKTRLSHYIPYRGQGILHNFTYFVESKNVVKIAEVEITELNLFS